MSDTTKEVARSERAGDVVTVPLAATAATYRKGQLLNVNAYGYGKKGEDAAAERFAGIADESVEVVTGGSAGDEAIKVRQKGLFLLEFDSTLTQADVEKAAYVANNFQMARVGDVSHSVFAGIIKEIVSAAKAWVDIEPAIPGLATLANAIS